MSTDVAPGNKQDKPVVLFVDDEDSILKSLKRFGRTRGWSVLTAASGAEALEVAQENQIDVVVSDMRMPNMTGAELLMAFREKFPATIRILLTGYSDITALESAINEAHIYNYLTKPWDDSMLAEVISGALRFRHSEQERERLEALTQVQNKKLSKLALLLDKRVKERDIEVEQALHLLQDSHERSRVSMLEAFESINRVLEWRETHAQGRNQFVTKYAVEIAQHLKFSETDIEAIRLAAIMHRIGLAALPENLRVKPLYSLNAEEIKLYRQYPLWGERCLKHSPVMSGVARIVRQHREYINGHGFPDGLTEKSIPIASQVIGLVTDFFDAYSGHVDKKIQGKEAALVYINEWAGRRHDKGLVEVLNLVLDTFEDDREQNTVCISSDLKSGMRLEENLVSESGMLLLAKGTVLNEAQINKLIDHEHKHKEVFEIVISVIEKTGNST